MRKRSFQSKPKRKRDRETRKSKMANMREVCDEFVLSSDLIVSSGMGEVNKNWGSGFCMGFKAAGANLVQFLKSEQGMK